MTARTIIIPVLSEDHSAFEHAIYKLIDRLEETAFDASLPVACLQSDLPQIVVIIDAPTREIAASSLARMDRMLIDPLYVINCHFMPSEMQECSSRVSLVKFNTNLVENLENAVNWTLSGYRLMPRDKVPDEQLPLTLLPSTLEADLFQTLSPTESQVLLLLTEAKSNKVIARSMSISDNTVRVHMRSIFSKLGVENRTEAALLAIRFKETSHWPDVLRNLVFETKGKHSV